MNGRDLTVRFSLLAKLGDTQELEEFIADLDKVLEGTYAALIRALPEPQLHPKPQPLGWGFSIASGSAEPGPAPVLAGAPTAGGLEPGFGCRGGILLSFLLGGGGGGSSGSHPPIPFEALSAGAEIPLLECLSLSGASVSPNG